MKGLDLLVGPLLVHQNVVAVLFSRLGRRYQLLLQVGDLALCLGGSPLRRKLRHEEAVWFGLLATSTTCVVRVVLAVLIAVQLVAELIQLGHQGLLCLCTNTV